MSTMRNEVELFLDSKGVAAVGLAIGALVCSILIWYSYWWIIFLVILVSSSSSAAYFSRRGWAIGVAGALCWLSFFLVALSLFQVEVYDAAPKDTALTHFYQR
jgi:signal transduction histidine kinase